MFWNWYIIGSTLCVHPHCRPQGVPSVSSSKPRLPAVLSEWHWMWLLKVEGPKRKEVTIHSLFLLEPCWHSQKEQQEEHSGCPAFRSCRKHWRLPPYLFYNFFKIVLKMRSLPCTLYLCVFHLVSSVMISGGTYVSIFQYKNVSEHRLLCWIFPCFYKACNVPQR